MLATTATAQIIICNNADLRVVPVTLQDGFTVTQLVPSQLSVRVIDACGQDVRLVAARAEFSNGDVPVTLMPAGNQWSGIWRPFNRPAEDVQVIFTAIDAGSELRPAGVAIIRGRLRPRTDGSGALQIDPSAIRVSSIAGTTTQTRSIIISNPANLPQRYSAAVRTTNGGNWLRIADNGSSIPAASNGAVLVSLDGTRLAAGTYAGAVDVTADSKTTTVPVTFAISSAQARIELSTVATTFNADSGGRVDPPQQVILRNSGTTPLQWSTRTVTSSGGAWLSVSPGQSTTPPGGISLIRVAAAPAGLSAGDYFGQVLFTAANAGNSPQALSVYLNVGAAGTALSSSIRPTALVYGGESPAEQKLLFFNATSQPARVRLVSATPTDDRWISVPGAVTTVAPGQTAELAVTAVLNEQATARYGAVSFVNLSAGTTTTVPAVAVARSSPVTAYKSPRTADCNASSLVARMLSINSTTVLRVGEAKTIDAVVRDNCGVGLSSARGASASLRVGGETLRMQDVGDGAWTTTWTPRAQGAQTATVNAFTLGPNLTPLALQETVTVNVQGTASRPLTEAGGIVNAASFSAERLAPGSLITIFGTELSDGTASPQAAPLPTTLANTRVELGGRELPLFYSSPRQVNAQVPYDLRADSDLQLVVSRGPRQSPPETVIVTSAQPAVFTVQQSGGGQGVILGPDQVTLADSNRPVRAGDAIVIYCTGLGTTNPPVAPGVPAPAAPGYARVQLPISVIIGGRNAELLYAGLAPGFAGLYQVNAVVPSGVRASNAVEVRIQAAGLESPPVTIAVRE
jgi:uncharacterized protein (TIGR03437 family)